MEQKQEQLFANLRNLERVIVAFSGRDGFGVPGVGRESRAGEECSGGDGRFGLHSRNLTSAMPRRS